MNNSTRTKRIASSMIIAGTIVLTGCSGSSSITETNINERESISTTGTATLETLNNLTNLVIIVSTENQNRETAIAEGRVKVQEVVKTLTDSGIVEDKIETNPSDTRDRERDVAIYSVRITVRDVESAGTQGILNQINALEEGSSTINIESTNNRPDKDNIDGLREELIKNAIEDARQNAEYAASAANVELGNVIKIDFAPANFVPGRSETALSNEYLPGSSETQLSVTVIFAIK